MDDFAKCFSRDREGAEMERDLLAVEKQENWTMTTTDLDDAPPETGVELCGIRIHRYDYGDGQTGLALSQPRQLAAGEARGRGGGSAAG